MGIISIDETNIENEHICCAIGEDKENRTRARTKKDWMIGQFKEGLVFKRLDERGKVFIEYTPIEKAWKPVIGTNYMVINCLWVSGKFKGQGHSSKLLDECISDARKAKMDGVVAVAGRKNKPFLTDKKFYVGKGFEVVDEAEPYFELLVYRLNQEADLPRFAPNAKKGICEIKSGFVFAYSNQCPFMEEYVGLLKRIAEEEGFKSKVIKYSSPEEAKESGSAFGTLGIFHDGKLLAHELMTEEKFRTMIKEKCRQGPLEPRRPDVVRSLPTRRST